LKLILAGWEQDSSNTLFDTLNDWNTYLKAENIEPDKLPTIPRKPVRRGPQP